MGFSKTKGTMYRSLVSEERPVRIQFWHNFHPLEMIDIKMIWADILIFISFLVTKAPSEGQPSSFIKTEFGHFAQKKKNRLYTVFLHTKTLSFLLASSHNLRRSVCGRVLPEKCIRITHCGPIELFKMFRFKEQVTAKYWETSRYLLFLLWACFSLPNLCLPPLLLPPPPLPLLLNCLL